MWLTSERDAIVRAVMSYVLADVHSMAAASMLFISHKRRAVARVYIVASVTLIHDDKVRWWHTRALWLNIII